MDGLFLPLLASLATASAFLIARRRDGRYLRLRFLFAIAWISLLGASLLVLAEDRHAEEAGIPHPVIGELLFWGLFLPVLIVALYFSRNEGNARR